MNFSDKLNNLSNSNGQNNNRQNYDIGFNSQGTTPNYNEDSNPIDYNSQEQSFNNPNTQADNDPFFYSSDPINNSPYNNPDWMAQPYQSYNQPQGQGQPYNQQYGQPYNQPYNQSYNQPYGQQLPPQQPFNSVRGQGYGESFESRNIIKNMNQYGETNSNTSTKRLGKRFLAALLDGIFISIPNTLLALLFIVPTLNQIIEVTQYMPKNKTGIYALGALSSKLSTMSLINLVVFVAYYIVLPAYVLHGRTLGKKMMKLRVVTVDGEDTPSVGTFILREVIGKFVSSFLLIGYFMILFSENHSGLHDRIAKTKVVDDDMVYMEF